MPLITTDYKHIILNDRQVPVIEGSTMKVIEIAMAQRPTGGRLKKFTSTIAI
jgi:hypothetical protein